MKKAGVFLFVVLSLLFASGCGTVSALRSPSGELLDLRKYFKVVVLDFEDRTLTNNKDLKKVGEKFAERIAIEIRKTKAFKEVARLLSEDEAIVISGAITKYEEGSAMLRLLIGFGVGSSYFDADVKMIDNISNIEIGFMRADKNSWVLGGGIASGQTAEKFMQGVAKKIASELARAKRLK